jgi:aspartyl-tRNA(Asn)/glutamyl-tRNA(Gln) amidotransferase subunit A
MHAARSREKLFKNSKNFVMQKLCEKTLAELSKLFHDGEISSREITESFISEIEAHDEKINAFVTTTFDLAREMANAADARQKSKKLLSPIDGMPIALKDVVCTSEVRTTACSNILKNFQSPYDATVWKKLKNAGAVLIGKTNTDEFTMGASTQTSAFGVTRNPHDLKKVAGGSSGGNAAAIAANFCAGAIGTETNGSIRHPSHFCGITGLKVSYGRVSRWGVMPMASSLDVVGPMAKTVEDCALILQAIAGRDSKDSTTPDADVPNYFQNLDRSISGIKIGIPREFFSNGLDPEVARVIAAAEEQLKSLGAKIVDIELPHAQHAVAAYYIIAPGEISANMARYDGLRFGEGARENSLEKMYEKSRHDGFGDEVKRRILIGTYVLSAGYSEKFYRQAQKVRTLIAQDFENAWEKVDAIFSPVSPTPAFDVGENLDDPVKMYLEDMFLAPSCLAGICGVSVPSGKSKTGVPIGTQIICPAMCEDRALQIAHQFQQAAKS